MLATIKNWHFHDFATTIIIFISSIRGIGQDGKRNGEHFLNLGGANGQLGGVDVTYWQLESM